MAAFRSLSLELENTNKYDEDTENDIEEMEDGKAMLDDEDDDSDKENEESQIIITKKKAGCKSQLEEEVVDDLFDIILENEQYTRK